MRPLNIVYLSKIYLQPLWFTYNPLWYVNHQGQEHSTDAVSCCPAYLLSVAFGHDEWLNCSPLELLNN